MRKGKGQSGQAAVGVGEEDREWGCGANTELKTDRSVICALRVGWDRDVFLRDRICSGVLLSVIVLSKEPLSGFANCALHSRKEMCVNSGEGRQRIIQERQVILVLLPAYSLLWRRGKDTLCNRKLASGDVWGMVLRITHRLSVRKGSGNVQMSFKSRAT